MRVPVAVRQIYELRTVLPAFRRFLKARRHFEMRTFDVDGRRFSARRHTGPSTDEGPAVVVIPGLGLAGDYMLPLAARLGERKPTWVPVLPGFGPSDPGGNDLTPASMADTVAAWMSEVGIEGAVLVANSYGCQVAIELAARHPQRVSGMVLEGPTMDPAARSLRAQVLRILKTAPYEAPSLWLLQPFDWMRTSPRVLWKSTRAALRHEVEETATRVQVPTLIISGVHDQLVPKRWADELASALPHGAARQIKHASHANGYTDPGELARYALGFIADAEKAATVEP